MLQKNLSWKLARLSSAEDIPDSWFDARVPGSAQHDYADAQQWPAYYEGLHTEDYAQLEDDFWLYRAPLAFSLEEGEVASIIFKGIDYRYRIQIGKDVLCEGEGMFHPVRIDVTPYAGRETNVDVLIYPAPKTGDLERKTRDQAAHSCKPAACYGWDWHPRLLSVGIWDEAYLQIENRKSVVNLDLQYRLSEDLSSCALRTDIQTGDACEVLLKVYDDEAVCICEKRCTVDNCFATWETEIHNPKLWYPVGYGKQPRYTLCVQTCREDGTILETQKRRFGLRRVRMVMNDGSWILPGTPKSRSDAPATLEVNGIRLFAKGTNWVNASVFPGEMDENMYDRLLTLVQEANMNIIRVWGGGFVNKEAFFDLCDEKGLMVWQEFPLACNEYPDEDDYLAVLEQEATAIVRRLRSHPCVCLWCGGNELFNAWSKMTEQHHALRLLDQICYREDRFTPFIMTSPLNGMAHGNYVNYDELDGNTEFITKLSGSHNTAYTEFGAPSMSAYEDLRQFMPEDALEDCSSENPYWVHHHGFKAWKPDTWVRKPEADFYFGGYSNTEDLCKKTQFIQAMCYRSAFEEMRRQWPHCSMALNWCFNEPWPTAANNNLVSWNTHLKPAYFAVQNALRPVMASLAVTRHLWWSGETFDAYIWMLNDASTVLQPQKIKVSYQMDGEEKAYGCIISPTIAARSNAVCGGVCFQIPEDYAGKIYVNLIVEGNPEMNSEYTYLCRKRYAPTNVGMLNV